MNQNIITKIKSRGYWRVNFQPVVDILKIKNLGDCKDIVEKNAVELRGWDYPHFPQRRGDDTGIEPGENFYHGWVDWEGNVEFWNLYQSGQFINYLALEEDWLREDSWQHKLAEKIEPGTVISITGSVIYQLTEIFEFLSRLGRSGLYDEGVFVSISLNNTRGRKLWVSDPGRGRLSAVYDTGADKIEFSKQYTKDDIVTKSKELALEVILFIFDHFGWHKPSIDMVKSDQEKLLRKFI